MKLVVGSTRLELRQETLIYSMVLVAISMAQLEHVQTEPNRIKLVIQSHYY